MARLEVKEKEKAIKTSKGKILLGIAREKVQEFTERTLSSRALLSKLKSFSKDKEGKYRLRPTKGATE